MSVLRDVLVIELGGLAPVPFAGLILADWGAHVVKISRAGVQPEDRLTRGKLILTLDLRSAEGKARLKALVAKADVLLDPYRPGVLERLGLGPAQLQEVNPRLIVARLTGYGQTGPLSQAAGHDINYLAVSGVLSLLGRADGPPTPPVNLLADFAAGGQTCVMGILLALIERQRTGKGQVIDAAMVDGAAYLASFVAVNRETLWSEARGTNLLDSGAPFYDTYATSDKPPQFIAVGCLEPPFFAKFVALLGLPADEQGDLIASQMDRSTWPAMRARIGAAIASKPVLHWAKLFTSEPDACATPVATFGGADAHAHAHARGIVPSTGGDVAPAPRLSHSPACAPSLHTTRALLSTRSGLALPLIAAMESGDHSAPAAAL